MKTTISSIILIFLIFFSSCKKSTTTPQTSDIHGQLLLIDKNNAVVTNLSGTTITVMNSNPLQVIQIKDDGSFEFSTTNIKYPIILSFSHSGFDTLQQSYSQSFLDSVKNGITSVQINLFQKSSVSINSLSGTLTDSSFNMICNVTTLDASLNNGITFFVQKNVSNISPDSFLFASINDNTCYQRSYTIPATNGNNNNHICLPCSKECGFLHSGDTVYIKAYGNVYSQFQTYYRRGLTNYIVYPNLNPNSISSTISFVVP